MGHSDSRGKKGCRRHHESTKLQHVRGYIILHLEKTNSKASDIDKVFLTGGTSFVPAVRRLFTERFDADRIESGGELLSIAHGLALIGERDDIGQWTA